jgi:hypothetical protein
LQLREAIAAIAAATDDVIEFDPAVFGVSRTITLGGTELSISNNGSLRINGTGANFLSVSANNLSRVLNISTNVIVSIFNLRIRNGSSTSGQGAGILNRGNLTLTGVTVSNNSAGSNNGGGVYNDSAGSILNIFSSTISSNTGNGAGIFNLQGQANLTNITVNANNGIRLCRRLVWFYYEGKSE